jgi:hypothetical protein
MNYISTFIAVKLHWRIRMVGEEMTVAYSDIFSR